MKFNLKKKNIIHILLLITEIADKKVGKEITRNFKIYADKDTSKVRLSATNFDIFYEVSLDNKIEEGGELCVSAELFYKLFRDIPNEEMLVESNEQKWMQLSTDKSVNKLPGIDSGMFPEITFEDQLNHFEIKWGVWLAAIELIEFAIGDNPIKKNLMGMNVCKETDESVRLISSDGYRMLSTLIKNTPVVGDELNLIIPKKSVSELKQLNIESEEKVKFSWNERLFQIESENVKMKLSLIAAKYPDISKLLFSDASHTAVFNADKMLELLKVIKIFVSEMNNVVKLTFKNKIISIEGEKSEAGESVNTLNCIYEDEEVSIGLNVNFLIDALQIFGKNEIEVLFNHPDKPLLLRSKKYPDYHSIIMPIRLQW